MDGRLLPYVEAYHRLWQRNFPKTAGERGIEAFWNMASKFRNVAIKFPRTTTEKRSFRLMQELKQAIDIISRRQALHSIGQRKPKVTIDLSDIFMAYEPFNSTFKFDDSAQPLDHGPPTMKATKAWADLVDVLNSLKFKHVAQWQFACRGLLEEKSRCTGRKYLVNFVQSCKELGIKCTVLWGVEYEDLYGWKTVFKTLCLPQSVRRE